MSKEIIAEFTAKVVDIDGVRCVKVPVIASRHVVQGDKLYFTDMSLAHTAKLLRISGLCDCDSPRLERVGGSDYMGTFRVNLGTRRQQRAAAKAVDSMETAGRLPGESVRQFDDRKYAAVLEALGAE